MPLKTIAIIGAGGNARELAGLIRDLGGYRFLGFLASKSGAHDSPVLGDFDWLERNAVDCLAMGIGAPRHRLRIGRALAERYPSVAWPSLIHPTAYIGETSKLEHGAVVAVRAVATEHVRIGEFSQLNFGCTVGHEAAIGPGVLINPGANIAGGVEIGEGAMVGTGAQVLEYRRVGARAVVGAGAVVTRDVPDDVTVAGIPAKPIVRRD